MYFIILQDLLKHPFEGRCGFVIGLVGNREETKTVDTVQVDVSVTDLEVAVIIDLKGWNYWLKVEILLDTLLPTKQIGRSDLHIRLRVLT